MFLDRFQFSTKVPYFILKHHPVHNQMAFLTKAKFRISPIGTTQVWFITESYFLKGKIVQEELLLIRIRQQKHDYSFIAEAEKVY